jgi:predicted nucleic acid-binding protein
MYESWRSKKGISLQPDPDGVEERLAHFVRLGIVIPRLWTDAYLAAFAISARLRLVTFDKDYKSFPGLNLLLL